jgi:hypothetical protein
VSYSNPGAVTTTPTGSRTTIIGWAIALSVLIGVVMALIAFRCVRLRQHKHKMARLSTATTAIGGSTVALEKEQLTADQKLRVGSFYGTGKNPALVSTGLSLPQ